MVVIGLVGGVGILGLTVVLYCCCRVASMADRRMEEWSVRDGSL